MFFAPRILFLVFAVLFAHPAPAEESEFRTFEQAPQIKEIADKYRSQSVETVMPETRAPSSLEASREIKALPSSPLEEAKRSVRAWFEKSKGDSIAEFLRANFFVELKGAEQMAYGDMIAPKRDQEKEMRDVAEGFKKLWTYRDALASGGSHQAGQTAAFLVRKFVSREDLYEMSRETGTSPYQDLKQDIGNLRPDLAYRMSWALGKMNEFKNPENVHWSPTAVFQLGKENVEFIRGFMSVQFDETKPASLPAEFAPQAAIVGQ